MKFTVTRVSGRKLENPHLDDDSKLSYKEKYPKEEKIISIHTTAELIALMAQYKVDVIISKMDKINKIDDEYIIYLYDDYYE